jgi:hypothetical protein
MRHLSTVSKIEINLISEFAFSLFESSRFRLPGGALRDNDNGFCSGGETRVQRLEELLSHHQRRVAGDVGPRMIRFG